MYTIVSLDSALFEGINLVLKNTEGNTIGGIMGQIDEQHQGYITHLWVDVSQQGKGFGRQLVAAFEQAIHEAQGLVVCVDTFAHQAPLFYEKCGYQHTHTEQTSAYTRLYYAKHLKPLVRTTS